MSNSNVKKAEAAEASAAVETTDTAEEEKAVLFIAIKNCFYKNALRMEGWTTMCKPSEMKNVNFVQVTEDEAKKLKTQVSGGATMLQDEAVRMKAEQQIKKLKTQTGFLV